MKIAEKIIKNIMGDRVSKNKVMLKGIKPSIGTAVGEAYYIGTEIENENGRWNDSYKTRDGFWVIHEGKHHHVYKVR